jgi:thiol:disulfide interchange protein DsbD
MGMGLPICLLAIFSGAIDRLPRSGDWMLWIRKLMGWVLIGMGFYFIRSLIPGNLSGHMIFMALALAAGIHLGLLDRTGKGLRVFSHIKKLTGIIIAVSGLFYLVSAIDHREEVEWTTYSETIMKESIQENRPVILDVYADWCIPCREMEKTVFKNPLVVKLSKEFVTLRLDITRKETVQDEAIKRFGIEGAPTIIFFDRQGKELTELRIQEMVEQEEFLKKMEKAAE